MSAFISHPHFLSAYFASQSSVRIPGLACFFSTPLLSIYAHDHVSSFSVGRPSPKRALSSSRTYSCVERRRVPSACYHRPPPTMQAQLPYVPHPSLLLKLRISSCRWEPLTVRLVAVFLLLSYACLPLTQLVSYYCCRPPHPWPRVLAVFVDVRHQLHAVVCPSMVSKRSYLRCKTDQIAITQ
jgi:hypothetical protein